MEEWIVKNIIHSKRNFGLYVRLINQLGKQIVHKKENTTSVWKITWVKLTALDPILSNLLGTELQSLCLLKYQNSLIYW